MAKKKTFEESLAELKSLSEAIKEKNITLDEAIQCYEKGIKSYEECKKILDEAKRKISVYNIDEEGFDE